METREMINQLKYEAQKHNNDRLFTGQTNITALCNDVIPKLEKLAEYETAEDEGRLVVLPCKKKSKLGSGYDLYIMDDDMAHQYAQLHFKNESSDYGDYGSGTAGSSGGVVSI